MVDYFLHSDHSASLLPSTTVKSEESATSFVYNPADPVPTMGGELPWEVSGIWCIVCLVYIECSVCYSCH